MMTRLLGLISLALSLLCAPALAGSYSSFPIANTKGSTSPFLDSAPSATTSRDLADRFGADGVINVKDYGAKGDGSTDDTQAVQNAVNAAAAVTCCGGSAQGATLFFPAGTYQISCGTTNPFSGILMPTNGQVKFLGVGSNGSLAGSTLRGNCANAYIVDVIDTDAPNFTRVNSKSYLPGVTVLWGGTTTTTAPTSSGNTITVSSANGFTAGTSTANATVVSDVTNSGAIPGGTYVSIIAGNVLTLSSTVTSVGNGDTISFSGPQVFSAISSQVNGVAQATASSSPSISGLTVGQTVTDGGVTWGLVSLTQVIPSGSLAGIDGMSIVNTNTTSGGALRMDYAGGGNGGIRNSLFSGFNGIHAANDVFGLFIDNSSITSNTGQDGVLGSYGIIAGQVYLRGDVVSAFGVGITSYNNGIRIDGGHYENNSTAIILGQDPTGASSGSVATKVTGVPFERDNIDIQINNCGGCTISDNALTGVVATFVSAAAPGGFFTGNIHNGTQVIDGMNSTAGLAVNNTVSCTGCGTNAKITSIDSQVQIHVSVASSASTAGVTLTFGGTPYAGILSINGGGCEYCSIQANSCSVAASDACFDFSVGGSANNVIQANNANIGSGTGVNWSMPSTSAAAYSFINNNSPWNDVGMIPASQSVLPSCGSSTSGRRFPITDASSTTFNAPIGSGTSHVDAYCDGTSYKVH